MENVAQNEKVTLLLDYFRAMDGYQNVSIEI